MIRYLGRGLAAALFVAGSAAFSTGHGGTGISQLVTPLEATTLPTLRPSAVSNSESSIGWALMTPNGTIQTEHMVAVIATAEDAYRYSATIAPV